MSPLGWLALGVAIGALVVLGERLGREAVRLKASAIDAARADAQRARGVAQLACNTADAAAQQVAAAMAEQGLLSEQVQALMLRVGIDPEQWRKPS